MKEKESIISGKYELVPVTHSIDFNSVLKKSVKDCISTENYNNAMAFLSDAIAVFFVFDLDAKCFLGSIVCRNFENNTLVAELGFNLSFDLPKKELCSIIYYSSQWILKFTETKLVVVSSRKFDKDILRRLRLLEFKKSKIDGYVERSLPDLDPTAAIISVISGL